MSKYWFERVEEYTPDEMNERYDCREEEYKPIGNNEKFKAEMNEFFKTFKCNNT